MKKNHDHRYALDVLGMQGRRHQVGITISIFFQDRFVTKTNMFRWKLLLSKRSAVGLTKEKSAEALFHFSLGA